MKALALLIIAGAFSLYGSAFLGVWTAPGLEELPTYKVVMKHLPWEAPAEVEPEPALIPISDSVQFLPHGVAASWEDVPVINLPDRKPQQEQMKKDAQTTANKPAAPTRPAAPRPVVRPPKSKSPKSAKPSTSYRLAGSSTRYRR